MCKQALKLLKQLKQIIDVLLVRLKPIQNHNHKANLLSGNILGTKATLKAFLKRRDKYAAAWQNIPYVIFGYLSKKLRSANQLKIDFCRL